MLPYKTMLVSLSAIVMSAAKTHHAWFKALDRSFRLTFEPGKKFLESISRISFSDVLRHGQWRSRKTFE